MYRQIPLHTHDYLNSRTKFETLLWRLMKGPSPKLALSEGGSRGNIEKLAANVISNSATAIT